MGLPSDIPLHSQSRLGTSCQSTHQPFHLACMCTFLVLTPAFPSGLLAGGLGEKATQLSTNSLPQTPVALAEEARQLAWGPVVFSGHLAQGTQPSSRCLWGRGQNCPSAHILPEHLAMIRGRDVRGAPARVQQAPAAKNDLIG